MAAEGTPYVGVIYAGIMLTADGPRLVEYNCRFGDPEAQVLLAAARGRPARVMAAAAGTLAVDDLTVRAEHTAATVVVAAEGYPGPARAGSAIPDPSTSQPGRVRGHPCRNRPRPPTVGSIAAGGRVLNAVGIGADLGAALEAAYTVVDVDTAEGTACSLGPTSAGAMPTLPPDRIAVR